ncbi:FUSC family protein [Arthrobacter sp. GN70]|uniref:FUSC family protein n=2 Tax=Arthrobacter TaxID=1663 RepID=A0A4R5KU82_9MICC|nr:FUSC family protein [Arthrobacter sp. GN70]TDF98470.1 FUSC family protein [Arthrobacter terricola]
MRSIMSHARALYKVPPASNDHLAAVRVALSVAVPALVLLVTGHPELTLYAVFGALTGMYGRNESHQLRLKHQAQATAILLAGVSIGTFLSIANIHFWSLVAVEAVFAGAGSLFADKVQLRPNGPFFGILALGTCSAVPVTIPFFIPLLVFAASAAFSILVGFAGWLRYRTWERGANRDVPAPDRQWRQAAGIHAARYMLAVGAAGSAGVLSGLGHHHWAMAAAAVPLAGADMPSRLHRGIHRIVGTFLGLAIVAVVLFPGPLSPLHYFPGQSQVILALVVIVCQFPTELFMSRHYGWAMVFFTPVILLMTQMAAPASPAVLIVERGAETFIGAVVGIAVAVLVQGRRAAPASATPADAAPDPK